MYKYKALKIKGRRVDEHRVVAGVVDAGIDTVVHHKDGNPRNNDPMNLQVMTRSEHAKHHGFGVTIQSSKVFMPNDEGLAECRVCHSMLEWVAFRVDCSWLHGRASICRQCWNAYRRNLRKKRFH